MPGKKSHWWADLLLYSRERASIHLNTQPNKASTFPPKWASVGKREMYSLQNPTQNVEESFISIIQFMWNFWACIYWRTPKFLKIPDTSCTNLTSVLTNVTLLTTLFKDSFVKGRGKGLQSHGSDLNLIQSDIIYKLAPILIGLL